MQRKPLTGKAAHTLRKENPQRERQHIRCTKKTLNGQGSTNTTQRRPSTGQVVHTLHKERGASRTTQRWAAQMGGTPYQDYALEMRTKQRRVKRLDQTDP